MAETAGKKVVKRGAHRLPREKVLYIGRGSKWGNPFRLDQYGGEKGREVVISLYRSHLRTCPELIYSLPDISGYDALECFCAPKHCHGDEILRAYEDLVINGEVRPLAIAICVAKEGVPSSLVEEKLNQWVEYSSKNEFIIEGSEGVGKYAIEFLKKKGCKITKKNILEVDAILAFPNSKERCGDVWDLVNKAREMKIPVRVFIPTTDKGKPTTAPPTTTDKARSLPKATGAVRLTKNTIFELDVDTIVFPVNCSGTMGSGLPRIMKAFFTEATKEYRSLCEKGMVVPGVINILHSGGKNILLFPIKKEWRDPVDISVIEKGLTHFAEKYKDRGIKAVAFPILSIGATPREEDQILEVMIKHLSPLNDITVFISAPGKKGVL